MEAKRFLCVPVLAVLLLMLFVYYTTIFVFIDDWVGLQSSPGTLNAAIFTLLTSLCLFSFFVCVFTDPGHVPSSYLPDVEHSSKDSAECKKCDKCFAYKPPRTHHCRVCRRCVLKMDHHCLWINNCVGYWNYKAFVVLTLYASMASIYSTILFLSCVFQKDWGSVKGSSPKIFYVRLIVKVYTHIRGLNYGDTFSHGQDYLCSSLSLLGGHLELAPVSARHRKTYVHSRFFLLASLSMAFLIGTLYGVYSEVIYGMMVMALTATLLTLSGWHVYLILHNMTTIEFYEGKRAKWLAMKSGQSYRHPFNIGAYKNITSILGPNMLKWLCPTAVSHLKDGVSFPTPRDSS